MSKIYKILLCLCLSVLAVFFSTKCFAIVSGGVQKNEIDVNGVKRDFYTYVPSHYDVARKVPVVMMFHGSQSDAKSFMTYTDFNKIAEKYNFIAVYPNKNTFWDWNLRTIKGNRELDFVSAILCHLETNYKIDKTKIYAAGYSSGADLSEMIACTMPDKFAAVAGNAVNMRKNYISACRASNKPISVFMINGTKDPFAPFYGDGSDKLSVESSLLFWKEHNKCLLNNDKVNVFKNSDSSTFAKYSTTTECADGAEVASLRVQGGGHTWPGGVRRGVITEFFTGKTNYDVSASEMLWAFFSRHELK